MKILEKPTFREYQIMFDNSPQKAVWCEKHDQPIRREFAIELDNGKMVRARAGHCYKCSFNRINSGTCDPVTGLNGDI